MMYLIYLELCRLKHFKTRHYVLFYWGEQHVRYTDKVLYKQVNFEPYDDNVCICIQINRKYN